jgi:hypothetical protein
VGSAIVRENDGYAIEDLIFECDRCIDGKLATAQRRLSANVKMALGQPNLGSDSAARPRLSIAAHAFVSSRSTRSSCSEADGNNGVCGCHAANTEVLAHHQQADRF